MEHMRGSYEEHLCLVWMMGGVGDLLGAGVLHKILLFDKMYIVLNI